MMCRVNRSGTAISPNPLEIPHFGDVLTVLRFFSNYAATLLPRSSKLRVFAVGVDFR